MTHQRKILKVNCLMLKMAGFERFILQQRRKPIPVAQGNWLSAWFLTDSAIHIFTFLNLDSQNVQHGNYEYIDQIIGVFYFFFSCLPVTGLSFVTVFLESGSGLLQGALPDCSAVLRS